MPRDGDMAAREWFSAAEIAAMALPGMPASKQGVLDMAERDGWSDPGREGMTWRARSGRGAGIEYHACVLPIEARAKLALLACRASPAPGAARAASWAWLETQPDSVRRRAAERAAALRAVDILEGEGASRTLAMMLVAHEQRVALRSLYRWADAVVGLDRADWMPALAPNHAGGRGPAECSPDAWDALCADFLRPSRPAFADCYRRLVRLAAQEGWTIPAERTLHRRMMALPEAQRVLRRDGVDALRRMLPAQRRDRGVFHALEAVNADGHTWDVFVHWPDGTISRPSMVAFQDLYSGKILSWRVDQALSWHAVRLAFGDMVEAYGIPRLCWLDNGREFAAKRITGGQKTRYRFRLREEEPQGLLTSLGVEVHWTTPYHGQAKPIERAFRDFAGSIAKHPAFEGAYSGNSPTAKPANYGTRAVPLDAFLRVVAEGVAEHNAREGRRSPTCQGRSFDETFAASYAAATIVRATAEQRRLWLLAAEAVAVRRQDGQLHFHGNRYWAEFLHEHRGDRVMVRFDPEALAEPLHVYATDGRYLGAAPCEEAAGFASVEAAQAQARRWRQFLRATRAAADAERGMSIAELAAKLPRIEAAEAPAPKIVRPLFRAPLAAAAAAVATPMPEESSDRLLDAVTAHTRQLRLVREEE